jgi:predicted ferric reductase
VDSDGQLVTSGFFAVDESRSGEEADGRPPRSSAATLRGRLETRPRPPADTASLWDLDPSPPTAPPRPAPARATAAVPPPVFIAPRQIDPQATAPTINRGSAAPTRDHGSAKPTNRWSALPTSDPLPSVAVSTLPPPRPRPPEAFARPPTPTRNVRSWRWRLRLLFWLGAALSVAPWWLSTSTESLRDTAALLTAGGRITGMIGGYLLIMQLVLASRLVWLERAMGTRNLLRAHRELGSATVVIIVMHVVLTTLGYARFQGVGVFRESWTLLTRYEDMVSAAIATVLLVATGLLGIRALRRALPYEVWHLLHLVTYAILLLGYGHQFANGEQLASAGVARYGWAALYFAAIAGLVWGRIIAPARLNLRHRLRVAEVTPEAADTLSIYVTGRDLEDLGVRAGQFFRWRFLSRGRWLQAHPFSLSAAPNEHWLRLTVKSVGDHTEGLADLRPGTRILVEGPSGDFTADRRTRSKALLIAAGSGIAPVRALIEELPPGAAVIYRAREEVDLAFGQELEWLAEVREAHVRMVVGRRDDPGPRAAMSVDGIRELVPDVADRDVYLCGPPDFVKETARTLRRLRVRRRRIHFDPFEF